MLHSNDGGDGNRTVVAVAALAKATVEVRVGRVVVAAAAAASTAAAAAAAAENEGTRRSLVGIVVLVGFNLQRRSTFDVRRWSRQ